MILETLELKDFRNYEAEVVVFHEKINILAGRNAQGKTNLIEAINLLALGKSFRTRREQELVRFGTDEARVKGSFEKRGGVHTTEVRVFSGATGSGMRTGNGEKAADVGKTVSVGNIAKGERTGGVPRTAKSSKPVYIVNGLETGTVSGLLGGVYTIVFSPEDLRIVKGDPETRRRFLDRELILSRPLYYHKLKKYRHILKTRNAFLKGERMSSELLDIYDEQLAEAAAEVMNERGAWLEKLSGAAERAGSRITDGGEVLSVEYRPHFSLAGTRSGRDTGRDFRKGGSAGTDKNYSEGGNAGTDKNFSENGSANDGKGFSKDAILEVLGRGRERDILARSTEAGPHRDDFAVFASGLDLRVYGSQGQQRTAALSLRLAERELVKAETGEDAILLLDDVMSELDAGRQERLLESFGENQIFITAAGPFHEEALKLRASKVMHIEGGKII